MLDRVSCARCGAEIDPGANEERRPCPACGATARRFDVFVADGVVVGDFPGVLGRDAARKARFVDESRHGGDAHAASDRADGRVAQAVAGRSPRNEEGALEACQRLARAWSCEGGNWAAERVEDRDVDCLLRCGTAASRPMRAQVTRWASPDFWRDLGRHRSAGSIATPEAVAREMLNAVLAKAARSPLRQRGDLVLVLDAIRAPAAALDLVVEAARAAGSFRGIGFQEVWVVGPMDEMVHRIDVA
jgi:hypothetical protein